MTITKEKIEAVLARVEAATGPDREIDADIAKLMGWVHEKRAGARSFYWYDPANISSHTTWQPRVELPTYSRSLYPIVELIETRLPQGERWNIALYYRDPNWFAWLEDERSATSHGDGTGATKPLALCAAFLSALLSEQKP